MGKKDNLAKVLALAGAGMTWIPIIAAPLFWLISYSRTGDSHFDYLMPLESFPFFFLGGIMLVWAALRARARRKIVCWSTGVTTLAYIGVNFFGVASGLGSGSTGAAVVPLYLMVGCILLFVAGLLTTGAAGILLLRDLFKPTILPVEKD